MVLQELLLKSPALQTEIDEEILASNIVFSCSQKAKQHRLCEYFISTAVINEQDKRSHF